MCMMANSSLVFYVLPSFLVVFHDVNLGSNSGAIWHWYTFCLSLAFTFSSWRLGLPFVLSFLLFNLSLVFSREVGNNMGNCSHKMVVWPLTCLCNRCFHIIICIIHQMCLFIEFVCSYPTVPLCPYYWGFSSSAPLSSFVTHSRTAINMKLSISSSSLFYLFHKKEASFIIHCLFFFLLFKCLFSFSALMKGLWTRPLESLLQQRSISRRFLLDFVMTTIYSVWLIFWIAWVGDLWHMLCATCLYFLIVRLGKRRPPSDAVLVSRGLSDRHTQSHA